MLKGQFQGQQTRGERGECLNKRIRTKNILKIHMENFNFFIFFLFANYYNTHIVLYQQALSHKFFDFFLDRALRHHRP